MRQSRWAPRTSFCSSQPPFAFFSSLPHSNSLDTYSMLAVTALSLLTLASSVLGAPTLHHELVSITSLFDDASPRYDYSLINATTFEYEIPITDADAKSEAHIAARDVCNGFTTQKWIWVTVVSQTLSSLHAPLGWEPIAELLSSPCTLQDQNKVLGNPHRISDPICPPGEFVLSVPTQRPSHHLVTLQEASPTHTATLTPNKSRHRVRSAS